MIEEVGRLELGFNFWESNELDEDFQHRVEVLVDFGLIKSCTSLKGGIRVYGPKDIEYVLGHIQDIFQGSKVPNPVTQLKLSVGAVQVLTNSQLCSALRGLPPITQLELDSPLWSHPIPSIEDITGSPF